MSSYKIAILEGDGIGPEITAAAVKVLNLLDTRNNLNLELIPAAFGANAYFSHGHPFPDDTIKVCDQADAILKGPIGLSHAASQEIPIDLQPERGALLPMRARYNTYANIDGIDIVMFRELVGGLYFGEKETGVNDAGLRYVKETLEYDEQQIKQILHQAFKLAARRKKVLHNIHKSNVLKSSVLWNEVLEDVAPEYPDVEVIHMLVDAAATHLCLNPTQFDVMVMENMFGDILSDQGGGILGSLGLMPSACLGPEKAYYEPSHGSAPDIAGKGIANPYSMIGSVAMLLEYSLGMFAESNNVWAAMQGVFNDGFSTADLSKPGAGINMISTNDFGDKVVEKLAAMPTVSA